MADPVTSPPPPARPLFKDDLQKFKVVNDPIHGHIDLHPLIVEIINTPQFQRLRYISQLGGVYYVFPGATGKRFEHSIGTYHLAGELVKTLYYCQPDLNITQEDVLCVMIAGLCHDLGHGPFSHLFDQQFMKCFTKENNDWKHEEGSLMMFDYMFKENNLKVEFAEYNLNDKEDIAFIKGLIHSPKEKQGNETETGRDEKKNFLYEIVANKRNSIDVDKWDYFARDAYSVGIANNFDHRRLMRFARVLAFKGEKQICFRDKECSNIYDMFYTRFLLHRRVYQHKTKCAVEFMIRDALLAANDHILKGKNGEPYKLSKAVYNMDVYLKLTDHIYHQILCSADPKLSKAREIIERIERRDLYRLIGMAKSKEKKFFEEIVKRYADLKDDTLKREMEIKVAKKFLEAIVAGYADPKDDTLKREKIEIKVGKKFLEEIVACYADPKDDTLPKFSKCDMEIQVGKKVLEEIVKRYADLKDATLKREMEIKVGEKVLEEIVACYADPKDDTLPKFSECDMEIQVGKKVLEEIVACADLKDATLPKFSECDMEIQVGKKVLEEIVACYADLKDATLPKISKCVFVMEIQAKKGLKEIVERYADLKDNMEIQFVNLDYGMKEENPIDKVCFYRKNQPDIAVKLDPEEVMHIMPSQFIKRSTRIFSKKTDPDWCDKGGHKKVIS